MTNLRNHPMVKAWIEYYQKEKDHKHKDCSQCGYPHDKHLLCGATFGEILIGGKSYWVDSSNVEYFVSFREQHLVPNDNFHWRDDICFRRNENGNVQVSFYTPYNNTPQKKVWNIPALEWKSIVNFIEGTYE